MKTILHSAAIFSMLISLHGAEIKDPIDIAMDAAMERNGSTAGMCEAIAEANEKWEARLNAVYAKLKKQMPPEEFAALQQAQRAKAPAAHKHTLGGKMAAAVFVKRRQDDVLFAVNRACGQKHCVAAVFQQMFGNRKAVDENLP
jgi:hypothetical protein